MGGHRYPFNRFSVFQDESEVRKYARKYKNGKRVGRRELSEKFKALEIDNFERWATGIPYCDYCAWELMWLAKCEEEEDDEHDRYMNDNDFDCEGLCKWKVSAPWGHTRGVYALNREAFAMHDAHRRKGRASASQSRGHRSSGQKRFALKKDARSALRDFKDGM